MESCPPGRRHTSVSTPHRTPRTAMHGQVTPETHPATVVSDTGALPSTIAGATQHAPTPRVDIPRFCRARRNAPRLYRRHAPMGSATTRRRPAEPIRACRSGFRAPPAATTAFSGAGPASAGRSTAHTATDNHWPPRRWIRRSNSVTPHRRSCRRHTFRDSDDPHKPGPGTLRPCSGRR